MAPTVTDSLEANVSESDQQDTEFLHRKSVDADAALAKLEKQIQQLEARVDQALADAPDDNSTASPEKPDTVNVWGVPFSKLTLATTLYHIDRLIACREPGYFITANLNYNMLTRQHPRLSEVNDQASFINCDGMPMVLWSKVMKQPLPERVAGSELIYALSKWASIRGHRIYFLGGTPGIAQKAADTLAERYPGLQVAGVHSPPFRPLSEEENREMVDQIRATKPDILYVAFGQPKGEFWMYDNVKALDVPACVQIGASFDFVAGGMARAPLLMQKLCLEWAYRMYQEPKRLVGRYFKNGLFLARAVCADLAGRGFHRSAK